VKGVNLNSIATTTKLHSTNLHKTITVLITDRLSVRLYADSRPQCMETAPLHKGLVLMLDNEEVIEEGMGFGVPVIRYKDKTHFSSLADISIQKNHSIFVIKKTFVLDAISRKRFWRSAYIDDDVYSFARKTFAKLYLRHKNVSPLFNNVMMLRNMAKIQTEFQKVKPKGRVTVTYEIQPAIINVSVDFSDLTLDGCEELLVLNEQGSSVFDKYVDSNGLKLSGSKIGGWDPVTANQASMLSSKRKITFCLQKKRKASLFRGWENTRNRFSWAGLNYSLNPNHGIFDYSISFDLEHRTIRSSKVNH
jgi:hypothetical protein